MGFGIKPAPVHQSYNYGTNRQHRSSKPDSEARGAAFGNFTTGNLGTPTPRTLFTLGHKACKTPRRIQHDCGPPFPEHVSSRMAPIKQGHIGCIPEVGNANGGPICLPSVCSSSVLCVAQPRRPPGPVRGRPVEALEFRPSLGLPTSPPHPASPTASRNSDGYFPSGNTSLGENVLAAGCQS
uniref:Uncharacterized protein n=1 Tax=Cacopsylla melanoneura TaxID=428564 RepID=A0A8D9AI23_9HEMI